MADPKSTPKRCASCKTEQPLSAFYRRRERASGVTSQCKSCHREQRQAWKAAHPKPRRQYLGRTVTHTPILVDGVLMKQCTTCAQSRPATTEHFEARPTGLRAQCRVCLAAVKAAYVAANKERHRHAAHRCYERKKADYAAVNKAWKDTSGYRRRPKVVLTNRVRSYIWRVLQRRAAGGVLLPGAMRWLPYGREELIAHIERQFLPGMGWHNMPEWHVDHVKPIASFHFESQQDAGFQACWALTNLQPLWAADNLRKSKKVAA